MLFRSRRVAEATIREIVPESLRAAAKLNPKHADKLEAVAERCFREGTEQSARDAREVAWEVYADAAAYARPALLTAAWTYFLLNFAFFDFPWPWQSWTVRTPNALAFAVCVAGLTLAVLRGERTVRPPGGAVISGGR